MKLLLRCCVVIFGITLRSELVSSIFRNQFPKNRGDARLNNVVSAVHVGGTGAISNSHRDLQTTPTGGGSVQVHCDRFIEKMKAISIIATNASCTDCNETRVDCLATSAETCLPTELVSTQTCYTAKLRKIIDNPQKNSGREVCTIQFDGSTEDALRFEHHTSGPCSFHWNGEQCTSCTKDCDDEDSISVDCSNILPGVGFSCVGHLHEEYLFPPEIIAYFAQEDQKTHSPWTRFCATEQLRTGVTCPSCTEQETYCEEDASEGKCVNLGNDNIICYAHARTKRVDFTTKTSTYEEIFSYTQETDVDNIGYASLTMDMSFTDNARDPEFVGCTFQFGDQTCVSCVECDDGNSSPEEDGHKISIDCSNLYGDDAIGVCLGWNDVETMVTKVSTPATGPVNVPGPAPVPNPAPAPGNGNGQVHVNCDHFAAALTAQILESTQVDCPVCDSTKVDCTVTSDETCLPPALVEEETCYTTTLHRIIDAPQVGTGVEETTVTFANGAEGQSLRLVRNMAGPFGESTCEFHWDGEQCTSCTLDCGFANTFSVDCSNISPEVNLPCVTYVNPAHLFPQEIISYFVQENRNEHTPWSRFCATEEMEPGTSCSSCTERNASCEGTDSDEVCTDEGAQNNICFTLKESMEVDFSEGKATANEIFTLSSGSDIGTARLSINLAFPTGDIDLSEFQGCTYAFDDQVCQTCEKCPSDEFGDMVSIDCRNLFGSDAFVDCIDLAEAEVMLTMITGSPATVPEGSNENTPWSLFCAAQEMEPGTSCSSCTEQNASCEGTDSGEACIDIDANSNICFTTKESMEVDFMEGKVTANEIFTITSGSDVGTAQLSVNMAFLTGDVDQSEVQGCTYAFDDQVCQTCEKCPDNEFGDMVTIDCRNLFGSDAFVDCIDLAETEVMLTMTAGSPASTPGDSSSVETPSTGANCDHIIENMNAAIEIEANTECSVCTESEVICTSITAVETCLPSDAGEDETCYTAQLDQIKESPQSNAGIEQRVVTFTNEADQNQSLRFVRHIDDASNADTCEFYWNTEKCTSCEMNCNDDDSISLDCSNIAPDVRLNCAGHLDQNYFFPPEIISYFAQENQDGQSPWSDFCATEEQRSGVTCLPCTEELASCVQKSASKCATMNSGTRLCYNHEKSMNVNYRSMTAKAIEGFSVTQGSSVGHAKLTIDFDFSTTTIENEFKSCTYTLDDKPCQSCEQCGDGSDKITLDCSNLLGNEAKRNCNEADKATEYLLSLGPLSTPSTDAKSPSGTSPGSAPSKAPSAVVPNNPSSSSLYDNCDAFVTRAQAMSISMAAAECPVCKETEMECTSSSVISCLDSDMVEERTCYMIQLLRSIDDPVTQSGFEESVVTFNTLSRDGTMHLVERFKSHSVEPTCDFFWNGQQCQQCDRLCRTDKGSEGINVDCSNVVDGVKMDCIEYSHNDYLFPPESIAFFAKHNDEYYLSLQDDSNKRNKALIITLVLLGLIVLGVGIAYARTRMKEFEEDGEQTQRLKPIASKRKNNRGASRGSGANQEIANLQIFKDHGIMT